MGKAHKLTALQVRNFDEPGYYSDGAGLLLKVTTKGSKSWIVRYMKHGQAHWLGLGPYPDVTLAEARELALDIRRQVRAGIDVAEERKALHQTAWLERESAKSFDWCAAQYVDAHRAGWKNAKSADQWTNTLATYASPHFGKMNVAKITTDHVMQALEPIWATKSETASRVRGRIESVLDWATVKGHRKGDNPARWTGHLDNLLAARPKLKKHHPALPYARMADFMKSLRKQEGIAAKACEFAILTAARSGEVRGATWSEIDLEAGLWIIPAERMKMTRDHRVPLSKAALAVLADMKKISNGGELIFYGMKEGAQLSDMTLTATIKRMDEASTKAGGEGWRDSAGKIVTMHGMRSTFRDWAAELTNHPSEMAEMALAHRVGNAVELAYRRGDMMEKRRGMMTDWANYCLARK